MTKLLLVEDDNDVREPLAEQLAKNQFHVTTAKTVAEAAAKTKVPGGFDIILLDWELPDGEGLELLRQWRNQGLNTTVIFLTARTDVIDKVLGLELGADDYMTKPFDLKELVARIRRRLRQPVAPVSLLHLGPIEMNLVQRTVSINGALVELKKMEFELLKYFMENPDRALARDEILDKVWGLENFPTTRTVDTHILTLRKKLGPEFFETLHGFGYRFKGAA